jgi:hypothetical protein
MPRRIGLPSMCIALVLFALIASSQVSSAATQVILGRVTATLGSSFRMRSEAGNTITVQRVNTNVVDLAGRSMPWSAIRSGDAITVHGAVVATGVVNAIDVRIRSGPVPEGRHVVMGVVTRMLGNALQMRSNAGYTLTINRRNANVINAVGGASSWGALRVGQPITVYGDVVTDGVLNAINIRIR